MNIAQLEVIKTDYQQKNPNLEKIKIAIYNQSLYLNYFNSTKDL
jgi:hypothetical protein